MLLIPDRIGDHAVRFAAKRIAQDAARGFRLPSLRIASTEAGGSKHPPFTGSMMMTGLPCFLATS